MRRPDELRAGIAAALDAKTNADRRTSVIASAHSFEGRPTNMLQMIERAGCGVAMSNAAPAVRRVADHVTDSNDEAGVARAVDRLLDGRW